MNDRATHGTKHPGTPGETDVYVSHEVWDAPTRVLHWLNAALFLAVAALGFLFMYRELLHVEGRPAKIAFKYVHSVAGLCLLGTFTARLVWGFFGNRFARFSSLLIRRDTLPAAHRELQELRSPGGGPRRLGHGPLGRLSATAMFAVLCISLSTGLLRANTDLYFPPFGRSIAAHIAKPGVDPSTVDPADKSWMDPSKGGTIGFVGNIAGTLHRVSAWTLVALAALHVGGLVFKELRQGGGVFSSMIVGRKTFRVSDPFTQED